MRKYQDFFETSNNAEAIGTIYTSKSRNSGAGGGGENIPGFSSDRVTTETAGVTLPV